MHRLNDTQQKWLAGVLRLLGRSGILLSVNLQKVMAGSYINDQLGKSVRATRPKMPSATEAVKKVVGEPDRDEIERKKNTPPPSVTGVGPQQAGRPARRLPHERSRRIRQASDGPSFI
jgi:hypothetical protein